MKLLQVRVHKIFRDSTDIIILNIDTISDLTISKKIENLRCIGTSSTIKKVITGCWVTTGCFYLYTHMYIELICNMCIFV